MKQSLKKLMTRVFWGGFISTMAMTSALAYWSGSYYYHGPYYHQDHYYYAGGNDLAAGLLVGGAVGFMAGAAMASQPEPIYEETYYYEPEPVCYKKKAWSRRFCNEDGCFKKTAWKTVCE